MDFYVFSAAFIFRWTLSPLNSAPYDFQEVCSGDIMKVFGDLLELRSALTFSVIVLTDG